jgi:tRNA(Ile)-lysidine synthase
MSKPEHRASASASAADVDAASQKPIGPDERDQLLRSLRLPLAIAVSGGPDSVALMHLVAGWLNAEPRPCPTGGGAPPVLVLTVDHGLRPGSADEARWVEAEAARLGLAHVTLRWQGAKPRTGIQQAAREARLALISDYVAHEQLPVLREVLLAHHRDDQAETLLMRLARGSGVDGLSGMREVETWAWVRCDHPVEEISVVFRRPLLGIGKDRLIATLEASGTRFLVDPSNQNPDFERVRLRQARPQLEALGLTNEHLANTARRLAPVHSALRTARQHVALGAVAIHDGAYATIDLPALKAASTEIAIRVIRCLVDVFGGQAESVRLSQIEAVVEGFITTAHPHKGTLTLGGCIVEGARGKARVAARGYERLHIYREPGRHGLPSVTLQPGSGCFWDRRFYVSAGPPCEAPVQVTALSLGQFAGLKRRFPGLAGLDLTPRAAVTLPAFWAGDQLLAVPHFSAEEPSLAGPKVDASPLLAARFADQHLRAIYGGQRPGARAAQAGAD